VNIKAKSKEIFIWARKAVKGLVAINWTFGGSSPRRIILKNLTEKEFSGRGKKKDKPVQIRKI